MGGTRRAGLMGPESRKSKTREAEFMILLRSALRSGGAIRQNSDSLLNWPQDGPCPEPSPLQGSPLPRLPTPLPCSHAGRHRALGTQAPSEASQRLLHAHPPPRALGPEGPRCVTASGSRPSPARHGPPHPSAPRPPRPDLEGGSPRVRPRVSRPRLAVSTSLRSR